MPELFDQMQPFFDPRWLRRQIFETIDFYDPQCVDQKNGGFFHCYLDDGTVCDRTTKSLVGTARFIYLFSVGTMLGGPAHWKTIAKHGLRFLDEVMRDRINGGYYWQAEERQVSDDGKDTYGQAFVLLALATATKAGVAEAGPQIKELAQTITAHLWDDAQQLCVAKKSRNWHWTDPYRGQNPNMHLCEAMIAAYEAIGDRAYLETARTLARTVTITLAQQTGGLIWEQYDQNWRPDWVRRAEYAGNEFRLYGYVLGHSIEWSKLLTKIYAYTRESWLLARAKALYYQAWQRAKDDRYGGLIFSITPDGQPLDTYKYYWVMAEGLGASARLAAADPVQQRAYLDNYQWLFNYCWNHLIDHRYGAWYPKLTRSNLRTGYEKSPLNKTDYHPITNEQEAMHVFEKLVPDAL
ncbi:AGE family epimerase/isomerase [Sporolactobacillus terrae]|uniref:N-acylglucosamine 2-epimerase n=1 Tax=Sporolactobacillus terrae TaxID=269673 RepID=A0ABX5Q4H9_9BACL|nr:AGE family epimerase/isomerase [Sporolactobacillus terrae]QAA21524.1 N-acylglucosamine 2-epimerase [Sporolactobacillus terrae]QAA24496.1 N-acylglucosamine 2-epimerase [Sporolactobacillus terrae]